MITAIHLRADGTHEFFTYNPKDAQSHHLLQERVGGYIELAPASDRSVSMYCNEEGKLMMLPYNVRATEFLDAFNPDVIMGDVVLVGAADNWGYDTELPEKWKQAFGG